MKKRLSIPAVLVMALLTYALFDTPTELLIAPPPPTVVDNEIPDSYAAGVSMRTFDGNGQLLDRTEASLLRRFETTALVEMEQPRRWGHEGDSDWLASADSGELLERNEFMTLKGDVRLRYVGDSVEFATDVMRINLKKRTALSDAPVRVWQGDHETRADQLYAILDWKQARLKGNVKTRYVPER